ncbi:hypothetical protein BB559_002245 [Furculomyces boomerangus]|uniref:Protein phosphatase n=2 Tax=Harpellales TaxID=61421 RepID=A0A2T9YWU5_9FUNG|nr:hypothetical protein BB559_005021 [Furculomyces boomerangus]PVU96799.1 hypothetical protein BB559_002245 [Furculomyces boomerangus]PVZ98111.1 hypothetical protein BB558_005878 [Smittium angustum]
MNNLSLFPNLRAPYLLKNKLSILPKNKPHNVGKLPQNKTSLVLHPNKDYRQISSQIQLKTKNYALYYGSYGIPKQRRPKKNQKVDEYLNSPVDIMKSPYDSGKLSYKVGEDAFFNRGDALGLADGIGGWANKENSDSSYFSRRLMHNAHYEISRYEDIEDDLFTRYNQATPVEIMREAYKNTLADMKAKELKGSSTICLALLRGEELRVANLGDSGLTIIRNGDMIFRTEEQQHSFNYPYQLGTEKLTDCVTDAQVFRIRVKKGDLIVLASDGLYDNLFDEDILDIISDLLPKKMRPINRPSMIRYNGNIQDDDTSNNEGPQLPQSYVDPYMISKALASKAYEVSVDPECTQSPFQSHAVHEGLYYHGGKSDDITIVSAIVTDLEDSPNRR